MGAFPEKIADEVRFLIQDDVLRAKIATSGQIFWVIEDSDKDYTSIVRQHRKNVFTTLPEAYAAMTTNRNDIVFLTGHSTHVLTSALNVTKNRVHFVGLDSGAKRRYGQATKVNLATASTTDTDIAAIVNTGVRNSFRSMKIMSNGTATAERYAFADGGEYTVLQDCHIEMVTQKDDTLAGDLLSNGDSSRYVNCTFGTTVTIIGGSSIIRPSIQLKRGVISGKVSRDVEFINCLFWLKAVDTTNTFVDATGVTDVGRMLLFQDCIFFNTELATAIPAEAVTSSGGKQTEGLILLKNCTGVNVTLMKEASVGIWVDGAVPTHNTTGVAKEA